MSTLSQASTPAAPWRRTFLDHLSKMDSPEFVFTSLAASTANDAPTTYVPRARFCIFRGMWAELPENARNEAPRNEHVYESDLLTFTSDVRMQKVPEIFASSHGHGEVSQSQGSGGGGPVEAVFWVKETKTQWRFKGHAYVIDRDIEGSGEESSGVRTVKSKVGERMRVVREEAKDAWSWVTELTAQFGNLSPGMRGSFRNPPPGTPLSSTPSEDGLALGHKVTDNEDEIARRNFRVVIIVPDDVEQTELTDPDHSRRWRYSLGGADNIDGKEPIAGKAWVCEELWP